MTYSFKQSINLTLPILLVLLLGTPTQATASIDTTALVGSTAGGFSVNQGTANYTIPITVPPGIAGMQPKLSINYNSNASNGQLGLGFSLSGLSVIHRCAKTIVTDGIKGGVNYNNNDRYCLNGQRLIAISGVDGQSGSEYRTEINSFSKIKYNGNYWTVKTKSGQTFEYGNTQTSKIEAQGESTVRLWAVNKITDVTNNAINYIYNEDNVNGEYTLSRINYTDNSVKLTYEDRDDVSTSYQAGSKLQQTKRLSNITTHVNNNIIRTYDLEYQYQGAPERSRLISIEECVNGQCLPKTEFEWQYSSSNNSFDSGKRWKDSLGDNWKNRPIHKGGEHSTLIDINGDGRPDRVFDRNPKNNQQGIYVHLNTGSGFSSGWRWQNDLGDNWKNHPIHKGGKHSTLIDMNGDGRPDRVFDRNPSNDQEGIYVYLNTGSGFDSGQQWQNDLGDSWKNHPIHEGGQHSTLIDMNGDGLPDRVFDRNPGNDHKGIYVYLNTGSGFDSGQQWQNNLSDYCCNNWKNYPIYEGGEYSTLIDMNGDGLPDRVFDRNPSNDQEGIYVYLNTGSGFDSGQQWQNDLGDNWKNNPIQKGGEHSTLIDMNGDGLPDRVFDRNPSSNQEGIYVYLNTGSGFDSGQQWQNDLGDSWKNRPIHKGGEYSTLIDMNGDGLPDRVFDRNPSSNQEGIYVYLNTGSGFDSGQQWQNDLGDSWKNRPIHKGGEYSTLIDMNGDGLPDRVFDRAPDNDQQGVYVFLNQSDKRKLRSITNGFGTQTIINYKPLTDDMVHYKRKGFYPNISIRNASQVVSSVTTDNAIGGQNTTTYKYYGAKVNLKGRGNLGFAKIKERNLQSNKSTSTKYSQTYPYIGRITSTEVGYIVSRRFRLLSNQTNTYQNKSSYNNKVDSPYLTQSLKQFYKFNLGNSLVLTTVITNQSNIDNYGNVGTIEVTTAGSGKTFTKITQNTYSNNATNWHLGRLTASTVTHKAPNTPNIRRSSNFTYNNKGLLTSETIEPNTSKALTTTYEYDNFGNKIKATTSANGITNRNTATKYSADGKFPIKATNALGHSETKTFDAKTGNILTLTGPNSLTTTWQYDALGRKKLETRADDTTTSTNYQWAEDESPNSLYKTTTTTSGSNPKTTYFDAFNHKVREQHTGFDGRKINSDTYYDNLGRVDRASLPYFTDEQSYFITTQYDAIGRLTSTTKPADQGNTTTSSTFYHGFFTTTTNTLDRQALGHQKNTTKNAIGKIIYMNEPEGSWLAHQHDAIGNLIQTNVGGVITTMSYDNRGNKISMNDPDMGIWSYTYNALGELISQTDAKSQTSTISYDKLGRMTQRVEPEGTTNWQYDTKANGIGKLAQVTAPLGYKKEYSYDSLGRVGTITTHANNQSFNIQNQYDQYSRLSTQTRPQNFKVENVYNQYGYLMAKRAPKDQISDYDWEHLTKLTQDSLVNVEEALTKANEFEQKANVYSSSAKNYRLYADYYTNTSAELIQKAQELRNNVDLLEEIVVRLQKEAKQYTDSAKGYLIAARRFQHLSNVNVADDQERSYIDSNTNSKTRGVAFYSYGSIAAKSNTNGYAWCSNQATCVYWANVSKQCAIINTNQAKQKLELAQKYINSSGVEKQAFANHEADNYNKKANYYTRYAVNYTDLSNEYLEQAQESVNQAKYWRGVTSNAPDYQAMLADTNNIYFWRAKSRDASGRLTGHIVGNGLSTEQQYNPATGHLFTIKSGFGNTDGIRNLEYEYDLMDNVTQRQNHQSGLSESFQYDGLDRLTQSNTTGSIAGVDYNDTTSYQYDINGNIIHKSDIGNYNYNTPSQASPHAPQSITRPNTNANNQDRSYTYDANGNMTKNDDKIIQWTSFDKPKRFTKSNSNDNTTFVYAPNRSRYQKTQTKASSNTTITTTYIGKLYEQIKQNTSTEHKHFIYADGQLIAINIKTDTTAGTPSIPDKTRYLHYDNLGSIDTITNGQGNIVERMAYTAFGQRRQGDWRASDPLLPIIPALTNRGFTGHEHIDEMGFIHMNGRVYDPSIGRFLSADPTIQHPYNTQDYNRYSYTTNNPLKYVDMNGFGWLSKTWGKIWKAIKKYDKVILSAVIAYYTGGFVTGSAWANCTAVGSSWAGVATAGAAGGGAFGASITLLYGGSVSDAINAAITGSIAGAITGGIAGIYGDTWNIQRIGVSAMGGGISTELQGGSFKDGLRAGMISASLRHLYNKIVGFDIDATKAKNGGAAPIKGENGKPIEGYNNIGYQGQDDSKSLFYEGKLVSKVLNVAPAGINAVAGLHDTFQINMTGWYRTIFNVPGMAAAAVITYGGMIDAYGISAQLVVRDRVKRY